MVVVTASACPLPRIGLGMAALGRPGYINLDRSAIFGTHDRTVQDMQEQANLVMDELFAMGRQQLQNKEEEASDHATGGGVWLDCARSYGLSEMFVGDYLRSRHIPKDEVYVSSKWGYSTLPQ